MQLYVNESCKPLSFVGNIPVFGFRPGMVGIIQR